MKHDQFVKDGIKCKDSEGNTTDDPIIDIKRALDDLIRYGASIALLQSALEDLDEE